MGVLHYGCTPLRVVPWFVLLTSEDNWYWGQEIAASHKVSTAQVALRFATQLGSSSVAVSPGLNEGYAIEDLGLGGFTLSTKEMATLAAI